MIERMHDFFNARAIGYEDRMKQIASYEDELKKLAAQIDGTADRIDILDLGCGTGLEVGYVLQRAPNARFLCVDMAVKMLDILKTTITLMNDLSAMLAYFPLINPILIFCD